MNTAALVKTAFKTALISPNENTPIIELELKNTVSTEGLCMNKLQEAKIEATAAALNVGTVKLANAILVSGLETSLAQLYENNSKIYKNQVKQAVTNHPSQLPPNVLAQLTKALNQTLTAATNQVKAAEQTNTNTSGPRRTR